MKATLHVEYPFHQHMLFLQTPIDKQIEQVLKNEWLSGGCVQGKRDLQFPYKSEDAAKKAKAQLEAETKDWPVKLTKIEVIVPEEEE